MLRCLHLVSTRVKDECSGSTIVCWWWMNFYIGDPLVIPVGIFCCGNTPVTLPVRLARLFLIPYEGHNIMSTMYMYPRSVNGQNSPLIVMMCNGPWIVITFNTTDKQYRLHHWAVIYYMSCLYQGYPLTFRHLQASSHLYHCHLFCIGYGSMKQIWTKTMYQTDGSIIKSYQPQSVAGVPQLNNSDEVPVFNKPCTLPVNQCMKFLNNLS